MSSRAASALLAASLALLSAAVLVLPTAAAATATVSANGATTHVTVVAGTYTITASGTYGFGVDGDGDPMIADATYSWTDTYGPCYDWPGNNLDLLVDGASPWSTPCDPASHTYGTTYSCQQQTCTIAFHIQDDDHADNWGSLTVTVSEAGIPTCFAYTPAALTNACLYTGEGTTSVPTPTVTTTPTPVCIVGSVCPAVPVPSVVLGSTPVEHGTLEGYVEATVLCGLNLGCRVTLP